MVDQHDRIGSHQYDLVDAACEAADRLANERGVKPRRVHDAVSLLAVLLDGPTLEESQFRALNVLVEVAGHIGMGTALRILGTADIAKFIELHRKATIESAVGQMAIDLDVGKQQLQDMLDALVDALRSGSLVDQLRCSHDVSTAKRMLSDALNHLTLDDVSRLFETQDLRTVYKRWLIVWYLGHDSTPLFSRDQLAQHLDVFIRYLSDNRDAIVETGFPAEMPRESPWIFHTLQPLYPVKSCSMRSGLRGFVKPVWLASTEQHPAPVPCEYGRADLCPYLGLTPGEAHRIHYDRNELFDVKLKVLKTCWEAIRQRGKTSFWSRCWDLVTTTYVDDRADFYLNLDRSLMGWDANHWRDNGTLQSGPTGGLTNLLEVVGHCESEIAVGVLHTMSGALGELSRSPGGGFQVGDQKFDSYFGALAQGLVGLLDNVTHLFPLMVEVEAKFWQEFEERISDALQSDLKATVRIVVRQTQHALLAALLQHNARTLQLDLDAGKIIGPPPLLQDWMPLSIAQVARAIDCSERTVRRMIQANEIRHEKRDGKHFFSQSQIELLRAAAVKP